MTIPVVCPHCDSTFQLSADLAGKAMRCPNPDCREVFTVAAAGPAAVPLTAQPFERIETSPFTVIPEADPTGGLPAITAARLEPAKPLPPPAGPPVLRPVPPPPPAQPPKLPVAKLLPPAAPLKPKPAGPKEVVWSGDAPPPPTRLDKLPTVDLPPEPPTEDAGDELSVIRTKRQKKSRGRGLLLGGLVALLLVGAGGAFALVRYYAKSADRDIEAAEAAYKDGNFPFAKTLYEGLTTNYPDHRRAEEFKFFADLSNLRGVVGSVGLKDDPGPGRKAFDGFIEAWGGNPLAQPESGFGGDLFDAGKRLADGLADYGEAKLKAFQVERATKKAELDGVKPVADSGLALLPVVDKYRDKLASSLDAQRARFDGLIKGVAAEERRLEVLAPFRDLPADPTAARIADFQTALTDNKLDADQEALAILTTAERELWRRVRYAPERAAAAEPTPDGPAPVAFTVAPADRPEPKPAPGRPPATAFAVARGVLYAVDADTGRHKWLARLGPLTADLDLPTRVPAGDGEWALVASESDGQATLTAREVETGRPVWRQPLPAPAAGRAVIAAGRVYLPLRDPLGTVAEFDLATGGRTGGFQLRQPIGAGLAVAAGGRPGQSHLFVPADAKRVFVFEVGREDALGRRLNPRPVKALITDHPKDSLRCEPVVAAGGDGEGPRTLLLCQGDAPTVMKVRAFGLPPAAEWADAAFNAADTPTAKPTELNLTGWAWTPPAADGERLTVATDAPAVYGFGLQQPGTLDKPLFALPGPKPASEQQDGINRSQVVQADEDGCWAVLAGQLQRLAVKVDPAGGLALAPTGAATQVGEPLHRPQVRNGRAVVVTRLGQAGAVLATGFDLIDGRIVWQRRLGLVPAGPAVPTTGGAVLADEDGSIYLVPADGPAVALAAPFPAADGKATTVTAGDGAVWVLAAGTKPDSRQLAVRRVFEGKLTDDRTVPLAESPAGPAVGFGPDVLIPLNNGSVWRLAPGADKLEQGSLWRGSVQQEGATCFIGAVGADEFVTTDGGSRFLHWKWPAGSKMEKVAGPYSAAEPLAAAPVKLGERFVAVDVKGAVGLYASSQLQAPVKRWTSENGLPAGKPDALRVVGGRAVVSFDKRVLVCLDPEADAAAWTVDAPADAGELAGWRVDGATVVATDGLGLVRVIDAATGKVTAEVPGVGPQAATGQGAGLVVLTDGTAVRAPLPGK